MAYSRKLYDERSFNMAILALFTGIGITQQMYDDLRREADWERHYPPGGMFHAASFDEAGNAHVADLWESPDALNNFVNTRLMPAMQKLHIPPPSVEVFPVHNINVYAVTEQYILR
jgi:hypothetical protein